MIDSSSLSCTHTPDRTWPVFGVVCGVCPVEKFCNLTIRIMQKSAFIFVCCRVMCTHKHTTSITTSSHTHNIRTHRNASKQNFTLSPVLQFDFESSEYFIFLLFGGCHYCYMFLKGRGWGRRRGNWKVKDNRRVSGPVCVWACCCIYENGVVVWSNSIAVVVNKKKEKKRVRDMRGREERRKRGQNTRTLHACARTRVPTASLAGLLSITPHSQHASRPLHAHTQVHRETRWQ